MVGFTQEVGVKTIEIPIDDQILAQLDAIMPVVAESAAVRELGIAVTRETVARLALVRGLKASNLAPPPPGSENSASGRSETSGSSRNSSQKAPDNAAPPTKVEVVEEADLDNAGMIRLPEGWHQWRTGERVPETQSDVQSYYDRQGWRRYWGRSGEETMVFYWSPDPSLQDVEVYDGQDRSGKIVKVQQTPYGPGHIVPHGWGA
jgi:hypothetical protein